jgi:hypothetical protein
MKIKTTIEWSDHSEAARWLCKYTISLDTDAKAKVYELLCYEWDSVPGIDAVDWRDIASSAVECLAKHYSSKQEAQ